MILNMSGGGGAKINGIIEQYKVQAGKNISAGDFVEFLSQQWGTKTKLANSSVSTSYIGCSAVLLNSSTAVVIYKGSTYWFAVAVSISASVITAGTPLAFSRRSLGSSNYNIGASAVRLSDTKAFVSFSQQEYGYYYQETNCIFLTVSGTTISASNFVVVGGGTLQFHKSVPLSDTKAAVFYVNESGYNGELYCKIATISGTNISLSSATMIVTTSIRPVGLNVEKLSDGKFIVAYGDSNYNSCNALIVTINGETVSAGTPCRLANQNINWFSLYTVVLTSDKAAVFYSFGSNAQNKNMCAILTISGTTISLQSNTELSSGASNLICAISGYAKSASEIYLLVGKTTDGIPYEMEVSVVNNMAILDSDNPQSLVDNMKYVVIAKNDDIALACFPYSASDMNPMAFHKSLTQAVVPYASKINGVSKAGGSGGSTIEVYVPNS